MALTFPLDYVIGVASENWIVKFEYPVGKSRFFQLQDEKKRSSPNHPKKEYKELEENDIIMLRYFGNVMISFRKSKIFPNFGAHIPV